MVLIRISVMNRRKYLMGVLGVASLAGCTGSNSGGNSQNQADTDEVDLFVRYNVEMIQDAHNPFGYESVSYGPHAAFATLIENRTSETLPPIGAAEEEIEAPFEPQPEMLEVWSVYDEIPAGEEKRAISPTELTVWTLIHRSLRQVINTMWPWNGTRISPLRRSYLKVKFFLTGCDYIAVYLYIIHNI